MTRQVGYFGALWWSVSPAAEQGLVAISMTNAMAVVAPAGGREALHGTNPIAVAIPGDPDPVIVDMRTNVFRMADYWQSIASGAPLPPDSGLVRSDGSPVTDVAEIDDAVYLPLAGGKGYGLGIVVDVLTAALAGSPIGREVVWETERDDLAAFFLVLDPGFFGDPARFADGVRRLAEQARATLPVDEGSPVRLPGERGAAERGPRRRDGIPVDPTLWALLEERLAAARRRRAAPAASLRSPTARAEPSSAHDRRAPRGSARPVPCDPTRRPPGRACGCDLRAPSRRRR